MQDSDMVIANAGGSDSSREAMSNQSDGKKKQQKMKTVRGGSKFWKN